MRRMSGGRWRSGLRLGVEEREEEDEREEGVVGMLGGHGGLGLGRGRQGRRGRLGIEPFFSFCFLFGDDIGDIEMGN